MAEFQIELLDWIIIIGYIIGALILGFWVERNTEDSEDYFLAGRRLVWPLVGYYFWATNQFIVQRTLGAKDINHGRCGALLRDSFNSRSSF